MLAYRQRGMWPNGLIDWPANGGQRCCHSLTAAAPLSSNHRLR